MKKLIEIIILLASFAICAASCSKYRDSDYTSNDANVFVILFRIQNDFHAVIAVIALEALRRSRLHSRECAKTY